MSLKKEKEKNREIKKKKEKQGDKETRKSRKKTTLHHRSIVVTIYFVPMQML